MGIDEEVTAYLSPGDPRRADLAQDPYPFFDRLRAIDPVYQAPDGRWLVTGYDEGFTMLRDRGLSSQIEVAEEDRSLAHRIFMGSLLFQDPPAHTRLRRTVSTLFTPRAIAEQRDRIAKIAEGLLLPLGDVDAFDFHAPAFELPVQVIAALMGLPPEDFEQFRTWPEALIFLDENPGARGAELDHVNEIAETALDYFVKVIADRRRNPGDDLISGLIHAGGEGSDVALSDEEIVAMCVILHIGGQHTTSTLLSNGIYHMTQHPETFDGLMSDLTLVPRAVEEFLRYEPPVSVTIARHPTDDIELGGHSIPAGDTVLAVMAAAGRDPRVIDRPNTFDIYRTDPKHLAFASGNHACIGLHLARTEAQEFMKVLLATMPALELAVPVDQITWMDSYMHRGTIAMPVQWSQT